MNKTRTLLALLCCLMLAVSVAHAEDPLAGVEKNAVPELSIPGTFLKPADEMNRSGASLPTPTDKVSIDEMGRFTIQSGAVTMGVSLPFGWIAFTQDLMAQLDLYLALTNDPAGLASQLIAEGISMLCYSPDMENTVMVNVYQDTLSVLLGNMSTQDSESMVSVLKYYVQGTGGLVSSGVEQVGGHTFVMLHLQEGDNHMVLYETVINNTNVSVTLRVDNQTDLDSLHEDMLLMLEEMTLA